MQSIARLVRNVSVAAIGAILAVSAHAQSFTIDGAHSSAEFRIRHLGVSNVSGRFNDIAGTITIDEKDETKNAVEVTIKAESIDTANEARDKHLRNADFFDVEKFPTLSFKSKTCKKTGEGKYEITGDFTTHGVTKEIKVEAEKIGDGKGRNGEALIGFETEFKINRTDYGMNTSTTLIGDEVKITVAVEAGAK